MLGGMYVELPTSSSAYSPQLSAIDTGDMTVMQRDKSLKMITSDSQCTVIIVSIKAGGVGVSLYE